MYIVGTIIFIWIATKLLFLLGRRVHALLGPPFTQVRIYDLRPPNWRTLGQDKRYWLYLLHLENKKYYVGITKNLKRRRREEWQRGNRCPKWLKIHRPRGYVGVYPLRTKDKRKAEQIESAFTKHLWKVYGRSNVRGGYYSSPKIRYKDS
ncbi:hypothetical protein [Pseudobacteriovorax antillogorgiicola]|uniref:GIY-YIG domain-containing protein n=1 Tax=Pseudobacteriovorax antillogorgiicola TaxID=1513793 RepID=A0A1Y6CH41_9BACT|nr:hypothetical protein [Pseudobacteriovorax antillogorgiicola]TCS46997.1 hypothetical protein EDD56_12292 [Pseudobacteriovorax antillogorgiicola]SMF64920.1 hypothetical protein SAMN06296036_12292 [Pseudobacteriovorax antillogorgiicola]